MAKEVKHWQSRDGTCWDGKSDAERHDLILGLRKWFDDQGISVSGDMSLNMLAERLIRDWYVQEREVPGEAPIG